MRSLGRTKGLLSLLGNVLSRPLNRHYLSPGVVKVVVEVEEDEVFIEICDKIGEICPQVMEEEEEGEWVQTDCDRRYGWPECPLSGQPEQQQQPL